MGLITIELEEAEIAALVDLLDSLRHFNEQMPRDFSIIVQHALMDSVKAGCLEMETAFDVFGHISRVTADIAYSNERIIDQLNTFSTALERA
ncbi:hypothetical protein [Anseongella ginsenosidimutans]|nr:hypothetical protein [Anseongella ginsenosidimutans]QEC51022.1 hypothetical protein FRZ59_00750 [Anseongella ginsenosidimutans]